MQVASDKINWTNTLFFIITPLVGVVGTVLLAIHHQIYWQTILLCVAFMIITGLAITAGYHRLFSHLTYKTIAPVRLLYLIFGAACFEGNVLEWSTDHRDHHRYTDTDKDPYNIKAGFWFAHIGWILKLDGSKRNFDNVQDLENDPLVRWQVRYYLRIAIFTGFILPMLIAALWGDALGGLIIAAALRITLNQHLTFCINSVCHLFGKQTYTDRNTARDNWLSALFTYGEGYHNFHHKFPLDYRNGIRYYHFDPSKWLIATLAYFNWASDLKQMNEPRIIQCRLEHDQTRLQKALKNSQEFTSKVIQMLQPLYQSVTQGLAQLEELEKAYRDLKSKRAEYMRSRVEEYREHLKKYRAQISATKHEVRRLLKIWKNTVEGSLAAA